MSEKTPEQKLTLLQKDFRFSFEGGLVEVEDTVQGVFQGFGSPEHFRAWVFFLNDCLKAVEAFEE